MKNLNYLLITLLISLFTTIEGNCQDNKTDVAEYKRTRWSYETNGSIHGSPSLSGENIFVGSEDSTLYSLNKKTGKLIWQYKTEGPIYSTPSISGNTIFCTSMDGSLYALNKNNGTLKWKFKSVKDHQHDIWDYHNCSPLVSENFVYFGSGNGTFYAIDKNTGRKLWDYQTEGAIHTTPIVNNDIIYFGNFDGYFYALNKKTGKEKWIFNTIGQRWFPKGAIQQGATFHNDILYFGSRDFNIYAINAETGRGMWNMFEQGSWIIASPVVKDTLLLFGTSDTHSFYALDNRYGRIIWKKKLNMNIFGQCEVGEKLVYFGALDGKIYALNLLNGNIMWEFQTEESKIGWNEVFNKNNEISKRFMDEYGSNGNQFYGQIHTLGSIVSKPLLDDGTLYFSSMNGKLYALE